MTGEDFTAWVAHMKARHGWSKRRCARELGCQPNTIQAWEMNGAPAYIGLACSALAFGLPPWRDAAADRA